MHLLLKDSVSFTEKVSGEPGSRGSRNISLPWDFSYPSNFWKISEPLLMLNWLIFKIPYMKTSLTIMIQ